MHGDVLVVILLLVFGWAAFLFGVIYVLCKLTGWIGRGLRDVFRPSPRGETKRRSVSGPRPLVCPDLQCQKVEHRDAQYCSQCGARLT